MKATVLAFSLLATGALVATPGAAAFQCTGFPGTPNLDNPGVHVDRAIACAEYMQAWAEDQVPSEDELLEKIFG